MATTFFAGRWILNLAALCLLGAVVGNEDVLEVARTYEDGGGYDKTWKSSGVPEEIRFKDERILAKGKEGTYCCGYTFAVAMKVATARGLLRDKSVDDVRRFQKLWYGATEESAETQCAFAVEKLGIGKAVEAKDAQPGDFLQVWRTSKSGHSVIFLDWLTDGGQPIGVAYRSSQGSTGGIADHTEYFSGVPGKKGSVILERLHFCRLNERAR
jgi:hypothetical protein